MLNVDLIKKLFSNDQTIDRLDFSYQDINDDDIVHICAALKHNTHVNTLLLNGISRLTDKGAYEVASLLRLNHSLLRVELARNKQLSEQCIQALLQEFHERFYNKSPSRLALNPHQNMRWVDEVDQISADDFMTLYFKKKRPLIIRGGINNTKAFAQWSPQYFAKQMPEKEIRLNIYNMLLAQVDTPKFDPDKMLSCVFNMQQVVSLLEKPARANSLTTRLYSEQLSLNDFPEVMDDIAIPDFCHKIEYVKLLQTLWFGQRDTHTHLHFDRFDNIFLQVYGKKIFLIYPPEDTRYLFQHHPTDSIYCSYHSSKILNIDILDESSTISKYATPFQACINAGDAFFMPRCWWHDVRSGDTPSISVNYWFVHKRDSIQAIDNLLTHIFPINKTSSEHELILSCAKILIDKAQPNYITANYYTLLQIAVFFHATEAVQLLLSHPLTNPNITDIWRSYTPLFLAITFGYLDIVNLLLDHDYVNINAPFINSSYTPLTLAAERGHIHIVQRLLA